MEEKGARNWASQGKSVYLNNQQIIHFFPLCYFHSLQDLFNGGLLSALETINS